MRKGDREKSEGGGQKRKRDKTATTTRTTTTTTTTSKQQFHTRTHTPPRTLSLAPMGPMLAASLALLLLLGLLLRPSFTRDAILLWRACGVFWQNKYGQVSHAFQDDAFNIFVWGTTMVMYLCYWLPGLVYLLLDLTGSLRQYKVQSGTNEPVSLRAVLKCVALVHFNHFAVAVPMLWGAYYIMVWRGGDLSPSIPSLPTLVLQIFLSSYVTEIGFYYTHRLLHHRLLYRHMHKIHHSWQSPIGLAADYAHPFEHFLSNVLPALTGPLLLGSHPLTMWVGLALGQVAAIGHHSGYHLPFLSSPQFHDYHHWKFNECYGLMGILDNFHGTDKTFRKSPYYHLHRTYYTLTPPMAGVVRESKME